MNRTFIISDTHFHHANIIQYEKRPFFNVGQMNDYMIERWNNIVTKGDEVIHLGDVSFANAEQTKEIISNLNGYKRLIMGNHDRRKSKSWWKDVGFDEVSAEPIIYKGFYILSHEPVYVNQNMPYVNVHGHIHGEKYESDQYVNACVEHWDYKPFNFEVIQNMYKGQE
jgi:calcineurin-like phosphoesterase family protein